LAQAQANLDALRGGERASELQAAQAGVDAAQARLAETLAGALERRLAVARAQISSAQAALALARLNLADLSARMAAALARLALARGDLAAAVGWAHGYAELRMKHEELRTMPEQSVFTQRPTVQPSSFVLRRSSSRSRIARSTFCG